MAIYYNITKNRLIEQFEHLQLIAEIVGLKKESMFYLMKLTEALNIHQDKEHVNVYCSDCSSNC